jgi:hypothetical protein
MDSIFKGESSFEVISKPDDYCFPKSYFYDTAYHLNASGRELRTEKLICDIGNRMQF